MVCFFIRSSPARNLRAAYLLPWLDHW